MAKTSRLISVYTGLYILLKFRFRAYLGPLLDDVALEKYYSLNIWANHQAHVSSPRICLVPVDSAQPSCFPDGPWRLESFWKQSLRANVLHLWAFRTAVERALSALERWRCFPRTNSHKHRLSICLWGVSDFSKCPRCCNKLLSAALVAASWCSGSLVHPDSSGLSHAPTQDPGFPAWANICAQRRAPRWIISTCCDWYSAIGFPPGLMPSLELPRKMCVGAIRVALNSHTLLSLVKHLHVCPTNTDLRRQKPACFYLLQHIVCIACCWMCTCKPPPHILPWQSGPTVISS